MKRLGLFLLLGTLAFSVTAAGPITLDGAQLRSLGIQVQRLSGNEQGRLSRLPGKVVVPAGQLQVLVAPVEGTLQDVPVAPGMPVRKGQVVARLSSPQALELQRAHAEAVARAALARANLQRDSQLHTEGIIPAARLDASRAAASEAEAMLAQARQALLLAGGRPGRVEPFLELKASLDGVLLEQTAPVGERLAAATPIARIARLRPLWVEIQVPRGVAAQVKAGDRVALPLLGVAGKLLAVGRAVDPASQNVTLRAQVDAGAERLSPGQAVEVEINVSGQAGQAVPAQAVVHQAGRTLVFVQQGKPEAPHFVARPVEVLAQVGDTVLVQGVAAGELLVVQGVSGLKAMLQDAAGGQ
jgi:RND family efflux transporter MFP subunit